jgi:hypothetical protein
MHLVQVLLCTRIAPRSHHRVRRMPQPCRRPPAARPGRTSRRSSCPKQADVVAAAPHQRGLDLVVPQHVPAQQAAAGQRQSACHQARPADPDRIPRARPALVPGDATISDHQRHATSARIQGQNRDAPALQSTINIDRGADGRPACEEPACDQRSGRRGRNRTRR